MDVWITPRRSLRGQADPYEYGASLRFFDPTIQAWRSTWIGPVRHLVRPFIAQQVGDEIFLEGSFEPGSETCSPVLHPDLANKFPVAQYRIS